MSGRPRNERRPSAVFEGAVGETVPALAVARGDYLFDPDRYPSEGYWAFCRFTSEEVPALRLGFQRGGFNGGVADRTPSPDYLQLHLELMTRAGAILWLPSGAYPASEVSASRESLDIALERGGSSVFRMRHWPDIDCEFRSVDGELEAQLKFQLRRVTVLPDCRLPQCLFAMWESMGAVHGSVRHRSDRIAVTGTVFLDHTRVVARTHAVVGRRMYVYTTLYLECGGGLYGYYAVDLTGRPIPEYCFCIYLDAAGEGRLLADATLEELSLDADEIASRWRVRYRSAGIAVTVDVRVQPTRIERCWGATGAPATRREFSIIPLVLDGSALVETELGSQRLVGHGLAEYFNADLWPADSQAREPDPALDPPGIQRP